MGKQKNFKKYFYTGCNILTIINWLTLPLLYYVTNSNILSGYNNCYINKSFVLIFGTVLSTSIGIYMAGIYNWTSYVPINATGLYCNYRMVTKLFN